MVVSYWFIKGGVREFMFYRPLPRPRKETKMMEERRGSSISPVCQPHSLSKPAQSARRHNLLSQSVLYQMSCEQTVWNTTGKLGSSMKGESRRHSPLVVEGFHQLDLRGAFTFYGLLIFFSGMEADRNVKIVGGDVAVL